MADPAEVLVTYDSLRLRGRLSLSGDSRNVIWDRIRAHVLGDPETRWLGEYEVELPWPTILSLLREYGSRRQQSAYRFRFRFEGEARQLADQFAREVARARAAARKIPSYSPDEAIAALEAAGFTRAKRELRPFQIRDLLRLVSLPHGANFSVPGAGKTTVTFALHLLIQRDDLQLLVVAPKSAFPAWVSVVDECIDKTVPNAKSELFTILDGSESENERLLRSDRTRFVMTYDLMIRQQSMLAAHFARRPIHLVLDESHRMKAGHDSQRGSFLLSIAPLAARRDILSGTPMPQGPQDLASQLAFLWPGQGMDLQLQRGSAPRAVLENLYVRTTKRELGLPPARRYFIDVDMAPGQQVLYGIVRSEALRQLTSVVRSRGDSLEFMRARRSVMRLLQLSANPILALRGITGDRHGIDSGVMQTVLEEGASTKIRAVVDHARALAREGKKVVIWTIFTETIRELELLLADLNPVSLFGEVPTGTADSPDTREGRLWRFHNDPACMVMIANPAAAGEGISLHTVCHDAIYLDRSYVSTHYLQSIDRIHRLGLPADTETNIHIYRTRSPAGLGSIDYSVGRRLATKIRALQQLLDDIDLHEIALDEENADDPVDYSVDMQDLVDLIDELEGRRIPYTSEE